MKAVFDLYMGGKKLCDVASGAGVSKGTVSGHLNEIEKAVGCRIVRGRLQGQSDGASADGQDAAFGGTRRASVRDFHSFRVTSGSRADGRRAAGTRPEGDRAQDDRHRLEALLPAGP